MWTYMMAREQDRVDGKTLRLKAILNRTHNGLAWETAHIMHEEAEKLEDMAGERRDVAQITDYQRAERSADRTAVTLPSMAFSA